MPTDTELMTALFVSEEGEIEAHPEWEGNKRVQVVWRDSATFMRRAFAGEVDLDAPPATKTIHWTRLVGSGPVAAGILRLIRERDDANRAIAVWSENYDLLEKERDEARNVAEAYAEPHSEQFAPPWEMKP